MIRRVTIAGKRSEVSQHRDRNISSEIFKWWSNIDGDVSIFGHENGRAQKMANHLAGAQKDETVMNMEMVSFHLQVEKGENEMEKEPSRSSSKTKQETKKKPKVGRKFVSAVGTRNN